MRVTSGLAHLEHLAAARTGARRAVDELDEEIEVAVAHLRVDGAGWVQIGRALGISRQGARQRFCGADEPHRIRRMPSDPQSIGR